MSLHSQCLLNMDKSAVFGCIITVKSSKEKPGISILTNKLEEKMFQKP